MKFRSRVLLAGATLFAAVGAAGATEANAGLVTPGPGDGTASVFFTAGGTPGLTNSMRYNSTGGTIDAGQIDATHYWISFGSMGGGSYVNAQLTVRHTPSSPAVDPICTIDKTKDNGSAVTVWFQCTPFPGYSLTNSEVIVNVTNRTHPDRAGATYPGFVALTSTSPTAASAAATSMYRSSGIGAATISRTGVGAYTVSVANAAYPWNAGTAFTTAHTVLPTVDTAYTRYCNPQSWYPSGTSMIVKVNCYMGAGTAADAGFSLRLSGRNINGGAQPGGSQWVNSPASAGYTASGYGWNSAGGTNDVRSLAMWEGDGVSQAQFNGATYAPGKVFSLLVSGYGGNQRCSLAAYGYHPTLGYTNASVRCFSPFTGTGLPSARYTVGLAQF